ncbi:Hypothetical Protein FCC1311_072132 [Hondaea fermentalgiana]|uniref:G-protein coupled receptors family 3 profile domain-containing protein n=1 Tax=Hondaea fermentalgiana TaxID=2315210 RepID=A0A2R5GJD1_9STRA|nr:Hypothetical Protein FCC1311_072132 [Hondaea fermentalgiana]|eukprot:GBG30992.1 Hypothetical Protein FCC1311_072132 [Hondaea fermentalgiana]
MRLFLLLAALAAYANVPCKAASTLRVGVLASKGVEKTTQLWNRTLVENLTASLHAFLDDVSIAFEALEYSQVLDCIQDEKVDFLIANPFVQTCASAVAHAAPIATLQKIHGGVTLHQYAGKIIVRADNDEINTLEDIDGKVISAVSLKSFGGAQAQIEQMIHHEVHPFTTAKQLRFTGSQFNVVADLQSGAADVGFVRMDTLETLVREGQLADASQFKIVGEVDDDFVYEHSTDLYSEWAFMAFPHVAEDVQEAVLEAVLRLNLNESAELADGGYFKFGPPASYHHEAIVQRDLGILHTDVHTGWETCRFSSSEIETLICPSGYAKYPKAEIAAHCAALEAEDSRFACPDDYECICSPCRESLPVEMYALDSANLRQIARAADYSTEEFLLDLGEPCDRVRNCGSWTETDETLSFLLVDHVLEDRVTAFSPAWSLFGNGVNLHGNASVLSDDSKYWLLEIPGQEIVTLLLELFDVTTDLDVSPVILNVEEKLDTGDMGFFLRALSFVAGSVTVLISGLALIIFFVMRKSPVVRSNRLDVLVFQCLGCLLVGLAGIFLATFSTPLDEIPENSHHLSATEETVTCHLEVLFPLVGMHLVLSTFFIKSAFLVRLYKYMAMKRVKFTSRRLIKQLVLVSLPDLIVAVAMLVVTKPHIKNHTQRFCLTTTDVSARPFMLALTSIKVPPLMYAGWVALQTESLPSRFNNSRLQWIIVTLGVIYTGVAFLIWGAIDEKVTATTKNMIGALLLILSEMVLIPHMVMIPCYQSIRGIFRRHSVRSVLRSVLSLSTSSPGVGDTRTVASIAPSVIDGDEENSSSGKYNVVKEEQPLNIDALLDRLVDSAQKQGNRVDQLKKELDTESKKLNKLRDKVFVLRREIDVRNKSSLAAFAFRGKFLSSVKPRGSSVVGGMRNSSVASVTSVPDALSPKAPDALSPKAPKAK